MLVSSRGREWSCKLLKARLVRRERRVVPRGVDSTPASNYPPPDIPTSPDSSTQHSTVSHAPSTRKTQVPSNDTILTPAAALAQLESAPQDASADQQPATLTMGDGAAALASETRRRPSPTSLPASAPSTGPPPSTLYSCSASLTTGSPSSSLADSGEGVGVCVCSSS